MSYLLAMTLIKILTFLLGMKTMHSTKLKQGRKAPDFKFINKSGKEQSLSDLKGKKVVLYFYPKDSTPGCTAQACNLRDNYAALKRKGYVILGVSADSEKLHQKFTEKYDLPFTLIPDTDKTIIGKYDVWGKKKFMGREYEGIVRTTFVIDEEGKIEKILTDIDTKNHTDQILGE